MKEWVSMLLGAVLMTQLFELILPVGEMRKYAKLVGGILVMLLVLRPLGTLMRTGPRFIEEWISAEGERIKTEAAVFKGSSHSEEIAAQFEADLSKHISEYIKTLELKLLATHVEVSVERDENSESFLEILGVKIYVADVGKDKNIEIFKSLSERENEKEKTIIMDNVSRAYNIPKELISVRE